MSLIGTLHDIKLADVLRLFATGKKSGLLAISDGAHQAVVRFSKGMIVHAMAANLSGEEALIDLFGWKEGQLTFVPEERSVTPNIVRDVDALILEGLKVGDRLHRMRELIPSDRVVFQMGPGPPDADARLALGRAEWSVIRLLDGIRNIGDVVEESGMPRADVARVVFEMAEAGFLERVEVVRQLRVTAKGLLGTDAAEVDERFDAEWRRLNRFSNGVLRIEVRTAGGRSAPAGARFRAGLVREIHLPRSLVADLGLHDGDEVSVRPIA